MEKSFPKSITLLVTLFFLSGCASPISHKRPEIEVNLKYAPGQLAEDLGFLFRTFEEVHPNLYLYTPKSVTDSMLSVVEKELKQPMTSLEFWKLVTPVVANLGDGHTSLNFPYSFRQKYLDNGGRIFPLDVHIDGNQLFVTENHSSDPTLAMNSEIISINDLPQKTILQDLRRYMGGETAGLVDRGVQRMFKPLLWAHYGFENHFEVEYISSLDGEQYTKTLWGITSEEFDSFSRDKEKTKQEPTYWTFQSNPDEKTGTLDLNSFGRSKDAKDANRFLRSTFSTIHHEGLDNLIIDLRRNGGGHHVLAETLIDYLATEPWVLISKVELRLSPQMKRDLIPWFLRWMPIKPAIKVFASLFSETRIERVNIVADSNDVDLLTVYTKPRKLKENPLRFHGDTFVLIDNGSYSMSVIFAAVMKDYHFAALIGEETGQSANPYGGNYRFTLPNTHLRASVSTGRTYRPSGQNTQRGVMPDFEVRQNQGDLEKGIDTVMEFTKQLIRKDAAKNTETS